MKILLINSPIRLDAQPNCIPYGLATIASLLIEYKHEVEIYDLNAFRPSNEEIISSLRKNRWDLIGLSGLVTTYGFQKWLIGEIKKIHPNALVVSGGGLATSNSDLLFKHTDLDIAVLGEGEVTILELCCAVEMGSELNCIPGLNFRQNGSIIKNEPRKNIGDLNAIPFPAWDLLPMDIYLKNPIWGDTAKNSSGFRKDIKINRSMNIIASRGCPFSCNYCYHLFGRSDYRFRSPNNVIKEIALLVEKYEVDFIGFIDDNLMASEKWMFEFCNLLKAEKFALTWGCHGRVTSANRKLIHLMAESGCAWIGYGIESGSRKILDSMNKKASVDDAKKAIETTREEGIFPNTTFIFGYPGETLETIQETIDFKCKMGLECTSFFATPYPGTPLYDSFRSRIDDEEEYVSRLGNATEFSINLTNFSDEDFFNLKIAMDANINVV